mgnify:FL=1
MPADVLTARDLRRSHADVLRHLREPANLPGSPWDLPPCPACGCGSSTYTLQMCRLPSPVVQCPACGHRWESAADHARASVADRAWMAREAMLARRPVRP